MNPWLEFAVEENDVITASCGGQIVHAGDSAPFGSGPVRYINHHTKALTQYSRW